MKYYFNVLTYITQRYKPDLMTDGACVSLHTYIVVITSLNEQLLIIREALGHLQ